jgi:hypothetical protein
VSGLAQDDWRKTVSTVEDEDGEAEEDKDDDNDRGCMNVSGATSVD